MFGWFSSAEMRASLTNISTQGGLADLSLWIRLTTKTRWKPSTPWATARNTSAIPPRPMHSSSRKRPNRCPASG